MRDTVSAKRQQRGKAPQAGADQTQQRRAGQRRKRLWQIGKKPVVLAHRGGSEQGLENSFAAFTATAAQGFRYIETDAHATKDGVVVLFHDDALERTTDGTGKISAYTWQQLRKVRDHSGQPLMRLDEALRRFPGVTFNVDAKEWSVVAPLALTLRRLNALGQVSLASFSEKRLTLLRQSLPGVRSSLGTGAIVTLVVASRLPLRFGKWVARLLVPGPRSGVEAVQAPYQQGRIRVITERFVRLSHACGMAVHVWTINREAEMRALLKLGVDGIITDRPALAKKVIDSWWKRQRH